MIDHKTFSIIYADPPWSFYNDMTVTPEQDKSGSGSMKHPPYPMLSSKDIARLPVASICKDNALLFIWTTDYHLDKCMKVMQAWGFDYKTVGFAWQKLDKQNKPVCFMGSYTMKSGIELCLLGTRGKNAHSLVHKRTVRSLVVAQRQKHSQKPKEVRDRIVDLCGDLPRVELFARDKADGWSCWGNEIDNDVKLEWSISDDCSESTPALVANQDN